jgi:hypothetical protein
MEITYIEQLLEELRTFNGTLRVWQKPDTAWVAEIVDEMGDVVGQQGTTKELLEDVLSRLNEDAEEFLSELYDE